MSLTTIDPSTFGALKDLIIVLTGGATGIGEVAVRQFAAHGARVFIGDVSEAAGTLASSLPNANFIKTDVSDYTSVLNLFKAAYQAHGRIDHCISNAGLVEIGQLFATDDASIEEAPNTFVLDVNLRGSIYFARVATHFLRKSKIENAAQKDASLTLVSSVAGFGDWPGLFVYSASKHGVMGLFRSTKQFLLGSEGIRVNAVLPNMTRTAMVTGVIAAYEAFGVPVNEPVDVANTLSYILTSGVAAQAWYISGTKTYEIEDTLEAVKGKWLGDSVFEELLAGQSALGGGSNWTKRKGGKAEDFAEDKTLTK